MRNNVVVKLEDHTGQILYAYTFRRVTISHSITIRVPWGFHGMNITIEPATDEAVKEWNRYISRFH